MKNLIKDNYEGTLLEKIIKKAINAYYNTDDQTNQPRSYFFG